MTERARVKEMRSRLPGVLLAVVLLILLLLLGNLLWLSYRDQVTSAEARTADLATIFETRLSDSLQRIDGDLKVLARAIAPAALHAETAAFYEHDVNAMLDGHLLSTTDLTGYRVYDASGGLLYASDRLNLPLASVADQDYFQMLRDDTGTSLVFSELKSEKTTSGKVLLVGRALRDEQGRFLGVVQGMLGLDYYLKFLALVSISLAVLNLLPVPILDGGHLLYYVLEIIRRKPLSDRAMEIGQQVGMALMLMLMALAFYNDLNRLISG